MPEPWALHIVQRLFPSVRISEKHFTYRIASKLIAYRPEDTNNLEEFESWQFQRLSHACNIL